MVKKTGLILASLFVFMSVGCADLQGASGTSAGKIIPPLLEDSPIGGTWNSRDGGPALLIDDAALFGDQLWNNLSFKVKRVSADKYLTTKYTSIADFPDFPNLENSVVDVITIYSDSNYLGELMKIDDMNMIFFIQNNILLLDKVSDTANVTAASGETGATERLSESNRGASGVLLGLKSPHGESYSYRTLWISADQNGLRPILVSNQIFFPRMSGFWEFIVDDFFEGGTLMNVMAARNITGRGPGVEIPEKTEAAEEEEEPPADTSFKTVNYIGNDYVAMEKTENGINWLQVLPVDNLSSPEKVKLTEFTGENDRDDVGENFGLMRENGHWHLIGRINYQADGDTGYKDFRLDVIPPRNLIFYDTLAIHWRKIKDRVPDALDAFTSPNNNIALVRTKNKLTVYTIEGEQLSEHPLDEIELLEEETIIMAEWATAGYVASWERAFISYGATSPLLF